MGIVLIETGNNVTLLKKKEESLVHQSLNYRGAKRDSPEAKPLTLRIYHLKDGHYKKIKHKKVLVCF